MLANTYDQDLALLGAHTKIVELSGPGEARVAVAPAYQGRVMTSTLAGSKGDSFGWLNAPFIATGGEDAKFNNYGGEDRFWLGPEAGQFGLWFAKGEPFTPQAWKTPAGFNTGRFRVTSQGKKSVAMVAHFDVVNYSGTTFSCAVRRVIRTLSTDYVAESLGAPVPIGVKMVGFESSNTLANAGRAAWTQDAGLVSIWILGQFKPLPRGKVIVPFHRGPASELGVAATTDYFGPLGPDRAKVAADHLLFACDGKHRSKIGISPARSRDVLGSFDPDANVLTVVQFTLPAGAPRLPYVNSLWKIQDQPFAGDVVNSYNDGEAAPGAGQLGPFYEIETSSPAAALGPDCGITHVHRTFHFSGPRVALNELAIRVLGVDLGEIK